jgi:site-specific DNA recombinase
VERIMVSIGRIRLALKPLKGRQRSIEIPWMPKPKATPQILPAASDAPIDQNLLKSIVRAHTWLGDLSSGHYTSIEDLGKAVELHPKVIRQGLRLAFLAPGANRMALDGGSPAKLNQIPKILPLSWREQQQLLG